MFLTLLLPLLLHQQHMQLAEASSGSDYESESDASDSESDASDESKLQKAGKVRGWG